MSTFPHNYLLAIKFFAEQHLHETESERHSHTHARHPGVSEKKKRRRRFVIASMARLWLMHTVTEKHLPQCTMLTVDT